MEDDGSDAAASLGAPRDADKKAPDLKAPPAEKKTAAAKPAAKKSSAAPGKAQANIASFFGRKA